MYPIFMRMRDSHWGGVARGERRGRMISGNNGGEAESLLFLEAEAGDKTQGICHSSAVDKGKSCPSKIIFSKLW